MAVPSKLCSQSTKSARLIQEERMKEVKDKEDGYAAIKLPF